MYLSRIPLDVSKERTQMALMCPNEIHGAVEESLSRSDERKLWRIDTLQGKLYMLILSVSKPDLRSIADQFGYRRMPGESMEYEKLLSRIKDESVWDFRLVANPTRYVYRDGGKGKIIACDWERSQLKWLSRQSENKGFRVFPDTVRVSEQGWKIFSRRGSESKVHLFHATFEGRLMVERADVFKNALIDGIGREKAYGMGLLTVVGCRA